MLLGVLAPVRRPHLHPGAPRQLAVAHRARRAWLTYLGVLELVGLIRQQVRGPARAEAAGAAGPVALRSLPRRRRRRGVDRRPRPSPRSGPPAGPRPDRSRSATGQASLCDLPLNHGHVPGLPQLHVVGVVPGLAVRRADRHHQGPARRRRAGAARSTPTTACRRRRACPARRRRSCSPTAPPGSPQPTGRGPRPGRRRPAPTSSPRGPEGGQRAASIYLCHNYCELGAVPVRQRAGRREAVPRHPPRRGRDPRHPGRHLAGRHRRRHREGRPGRPGRHPACRASRCRPSAS